jgi:hypothetical protein
MWHPVPPGVSSATQTIYGGSVGDKSVYRKVAASEYTYHPKQVTAGRVIYEPRLAIQIGVNHFLEICRVS